jgi:vacuolar-type H+-ATPase subunit I/STV1
MNNKTLVSSLLVGTLLLGSYAMAQSTTEMEKSMAKTEQQKSTEKAIQNVEKKQNDLLDAVNENVNEGFKKVGDATKLMKEDGKEKEALAALEAATGKFDIALAANPSLGLVPINAGVVVSALIITPEQLKENIDQTIDLLKENKVQEARFLVEVMQDDIVGSTTYLPMATYPTAIKLATKQLIEGKKDEAQATLATALSTFVVKNTVTPLGLVRAEDLLKQASGLDKNKDKDKAHQLLTEAEEQLEIATLLGYTHKDAKDYEDIKNQIKALKKEIKGKNVVEKMYEKVKSSVSQLMNKGSAKNK